MNQRLALFVAMVAVVVVLYLGPFRLPAPRSDP